MDTSSLKVPTLLAICPGLLHNLLAADAVMYYMTVVCPTVLAFKNAQYVIAIPQSVQLLVTLK